MKARKDALDDAISATKAAVAEGIVPGGGLALLRCTDAVAAEAAKPKATSAPGCTSSNARWRRRPARSPRTRRSTAASSSRGCARARATSASTRRKSYVDLVEAGIIDPTKVVRIALENAVSVASTLLLTEATDDRDPPRAPGW
jgi:chaperonin GroEL